MNVDGYTTCNSPLISDHEKVQEICNNYGGFGRESDENFGPVQDTDWVNGQEVLLEKWRLNIFGYDWFSLYEYLPEGDGAPGECDWEADPAEIVMQFFREVQPYLLENLVVQSIDHEGLRFSFGGATWIVPKKKGEIVQAWGILVADMKDYRKRFGGSK